MKIENGTDWDRVKREAAADAPIAREDDELYDPNDADAVNAFFRNAIVRRRGEPGSIRPEGEDDSRQAVAEQIERRVQEADAGLFASSKRVATLRTKRWSD